MNNSNRRELVSPFEPRDSLPFLKVVIIDFDLFFNPAANLFALLSGPKIKVCGKKRAERIRFTHRINLSVGTLIS